MEDQVTINEGGPPASEQPSDNWPAYTDSKFSRRHLTKETRRVRTSPWYLTSANLIKMYVGIAFISTPKSIAQVGLIGALIGFVYITFINLFCIYILLKARNRFKREKIVDICDLAARLYGEWTRPYMSILLICTNATFLMCYIMFFGTQSDQLMCKTFKMYDCGYQHVYSVLILLLILPIIYMRRLKNIGFFSIVILVFTFLAIGIILYMSIKIMQESPQELEDEYHITVTEDDRDYKYIDWVMLPVFCATMMTLFEGNQQILNLYSEADQPQNFYIIALSCVVVLTIFVAMAVGYFGYLAFGKASKSVILYNLPNEDPLSITAKICYILTVCGSFVIVVQPIFYIIERADWYQSLGGNGAEEEQQEKDKQKKEGEMEKDDAVSRGTKNTAWSEDTDKLTCCQWTMFFIFRTLVVVLVTAVSFVIPNINILLTFAGAILGTIVNIVLPVVFYNRAYTHSPKNRKLVKKKGEETKAMGDEDIEPLMTQQREVAEELPEDIDDPRLGVKVCNWIVLVFGVAIGIVGLVYVILELRDGAQEDDV